MSIEIGAIICNGDIFLVAVSVSCGRLFSGGPWPSRCWIAACCQNGPACFSIALRVICTGRQMKAPSGGAILSIRRSSPATSSALEKSCLGRRPKRRTDMPTGMGKPSYSLHCACMPHAVIFLLTAAATGKPSAIRAFGRREDQRIGDEAIVRASQEG